MNPTRLALITFFLGLGTFIQILDTAIANVSIPYIAGDLGVSTDNGSWVITSFAASNAIVLPLTGWLTARYGAVRLFSISTFFFSVTSFFCGISPNILILIIFRVLQGASAGALLPLSQALLLQNFPIDKRGVAIGIWGMIVIVAPVVGPLLGGWITEVYGWPWIFYINVPFGIISSFGTWYMLKDRETKIKKIPIDTIGLSLLIVAVASLQIFLDKGNDLDWFRSDTILTLMVAFVVTLTLFIAWNNMSPHPVMNMSFFRKRNFLIGTILSSWGYLVYFSGTVLLPLWLQTQMDYTAIWAGISVMPVGLIPLFLFPLVGRYQHLFDLRILTTISFVSFAITCYLFSNLNTSMSVWDIIRIRFYQGFAISFFFIPLLTISLAGVSDEDLPSASGLYNFCRLLVGSGIGTSVSITFWDRHTIRYHSQITELVTKPRDEVLSYYQTLQGLGFSEAQVNIMLDNLITQQASTISINNFFYISAIIFALSIPFIWLCHRAEPKKQALHLAE